MIVRILGEQQYRLDETHMQAIARLDNQLLEAVHQDDHAQFSFLLHYLVQFIRANGQLVPNEELVTSDLIVPAPDMTLHEARRYLEQPIP